VSPVARWIRAFAFAGVLVATMPAFAAASFVPVDEAATQPDFFLFRARLQEAVARRDVDVLLQAVDPQVVASFGDDPGIASFRTLWGLDAPATSKLRAELAGVLALGGGFDEDGAFVAPYASSEWPDDRDAFEHVAIVGSCVRVRSAPAADAEVVATVGFEIVARAQEQPEAAWTAIVLPGGGIGYVDSRYARGPLDYRARFEKVEGRWRLTSFVAGD
jgi:hypothetical protein